jgi:phosphatidylglycerophosphatase A
MFNVVTLLATWFYVGFFPKAPGTAGSLVALVFGMLIHFFLGWQALFYATLLVFVVGLVVADLYAKNKHIEDPQEVVIDEVAGQYLALLFAPTWQLMLLSFVLFRLFDIWKPSLIGKSQNLSGGLGIMMDDILAGFAAGFIVMIVRFVITF